jgi:hypothetical protein
MLIEVVLDHKSLIIWFLQSCNCKPFSVMVLGKFTHHALVIYITVYHSAHHNMWWKFWFWKWSFWHNDLHKSVASFSRVIAKWTVYLTRYVDIYVKSLARKIEEFICNLSFSIEISSVQISSQRNVTGLIFSRIFLVYFYYYYFSFT